MPPMRETKNTTICILLTKGEATQGGLAHFGRADSRLLGSHIFFLSLFLNGTDAGKDDQKNPSGPSGHVLPQVSFSFSP